MSALCQDCGDIGIDASAVCWCVWYLWCGLGSGVRVSFAGFRPGAFGLAKNYLRPPFFCDAMTEAPFTKLGDNTS
jgi:hypothetical protein